jgi:hypothetical protein
MKKRDVVKSPGYTTATDFTKNESKALRRKLRAV